MFNIIPQPVSVLINQANKGFTLHAGTTISPFDFCDDFIAFCRKMFNKKVYIHEDTGEERSIILTLDDNIAQDEGYILKCDNRRVYINAKTEAGLFYGLQTLKQLLLQTNGKIPYTEIVDYPRFSYRGYMLDCGRYFYKVAVFISSNFWYLIATQNSVGKPITFVRLVTCFVRVPHFVLYRNTGVGVFFCIKVG